MKRKELEELLQAGIISQSISDDILAYFESKKKDSPNRLFSIFGALGALLVGLGIILILAHNWDQFSKSVKTFVAFMPLVVGQIIYGYVLLKQSSKMGWREGASTFLFLAVGACISLVSQIYNIPGSLGDFLLTWMLLCLPLIYLMRSSLAPLLYLIGMTVYGMESSYFSSGDLGFYWYWIMLVAILPHYIRLMLKEPLGNSTFIHHWAVLLSVTICLGTFHHDVSEFLFVAYFSFFGICMLMGRNSILQKSPAWSNAYLIIGALGSLTLMFIFSFEVVWENLISEEISRKEQLLSREFWIALSLTLVGAFMLVNRWRNIAIHQWNPIGAAFLLFAILFFPGMAFPQFAMIIINLFILAIGILIVSDATQKDHLGRLNFGLLIISVLILCRFLDTEMSFVLRGLIFVGLGISFFAANYFMLQKRKKHA